MNRRQFLSQLFASSAALSAMGVVGGSVLSACSTMERAFSVEKTEFDSEVVIIGGGASGLMAALTCKKKKVPYRIYEASFRTGGRARVAHIPNNGGDPLALDLGVSTVDERHRQVFDLCRELNLELTEKNGSFRWDQGLLWADGKLQPLQKNRNELEKIFSKVVETQIKTLGDRKDSDWPQEKLLAPEALVLDHQSFKEFIDDKQIKLSPPTEEFLQGWCLSTWGQGMDKVSALAVVLHLDPENRGPNQYSLRGGFGNLAQTMFERSAGVLTDHLVKTGHKLVEVEQKRKTFYLTFQATNPQGAPVQGNAGQGPRSVSIRCERLVIALPISQIAQVKWSGSLEEPMRAWKKGNMGSLSSQTKSFHSGQNKQLSGKWAVGQEKIFFLDGSEQGSFISALSESGAISPEGEGFPSSLGYKNQPLAMVDWGQQSTIKGARWNQIPGAITAFQKWKKEFNPKGKIYFAGEFDSTTYPGTFEGALTSGVKAATFVAEEETLPED